MTSALHLPAFQVHLAAVAHHIFVVAVPEMGARWNEFRFQALLPLFWVMKPSQPELLVDLQGKLRRVVMHWALVDEALPPAFPLLLLEDVNRAAAEQLAKDLPVQEEKVQAAECPVTLAWTRYHRSKSVVHQWVLSINRWLRAEYRGTAWIESLQPVPTSAQAFEHWQTAARNTLVLWQDIVETPPAERGDRPTTLDDGRTVEDFSKVLDDFIAANENIINAEFHLRRAQTVMRLKQDKVAAVLMAYGHGVRARLKRGDELLSSIPGVWRG